MQIDDQKLKSFVLKQT